ncbi:MAG: DUF349 domain-containing protein [Dysgonamonadaceae bacterium]|jgi:hypothetical protein|nr:DUF349 domain-containing protein [Dysgonamonadaceae bacterium]
MKQPFESEHVEDKGVTKEVDQTPVEKYSEEVAADTEGTATNMTVAPEPTITDVPESQVIDTAVAGEADPEESSTTVLEEETATPEEVTDTPADEGIDAISAEDTEDTAVDKDEVDDAVLEENADTFPDESKEVLHEIDADIVLEDDAAVATDEVDDAVLEDDAAVVPDAIAKDAAAFNKEKKHAAFPNNDRLIREENLKLKKALLGDMKTLLESQGDFYNIYINFRKLQQRWKEIKPLPHSSVANELWRDYLRYNERFYDLLKINNELRDYDFRKNLELKTTLCEAAEKLNEIKDVAVAFRKLQKMHIEWKEIGPVAKELREEIWQRFRNASAVINKKHQLLTEKIRSNEHKNLELKTAICEKLEAINFESLNTLKDWEDQNKRVLAFQERWKKIGAAPRKHHEKIFERFRKACDAFFHKRNEFYKSNKETLDQNLAQKKLLCEQAEALKDSQQWKETTNKLIELQKEWKTIGPSSPRHTEAFRQRFLSACDYFFEQKNTYFSSQKTEESDNLKKKKELIKRINKIDESLSVSEATDLLHDIMNEWNNTGFIPFRDKDKINKEYHDALDRQFDRLKLDASERKLQSFKSNLNDMGGDKSKNRLLNEREKLMRNYERMKNDIQTYENNIGFLSVSSKGGGGLLKDMNQKIEKLKGELNLIVKKIEVIDENLDSDN